jgi:hypothetical protein
MLDYDTREGSFMRRSACTFLAGISLVATSTAIEAASLDDCLKSDAFNAIDATYEICTQVVQDGSLTDTEIARALTQRANALHFGNRPAMAIEDTSKALSLDPNFAQAYLRRAWAQ